MAVAPGAAATAGGGLSCLIVLYARLMPSGSRYDLYPGTIAGRWLPEPDAGGGKTQGVRAWRQRTSASAVTRSGSCCLLASVLRLDALSPVREDDGPSPAAPKCSRHRGDGTGPGPPEDAPARRARCTCFPEHQRIVHDFARPVFVAAAGNCASPRQSPTAEGIRALHARKSARTSGSLVMVNKPMKRRYEAFAGRRGSCAGHRRAW